MTPNSQTPFFFPHASCLPPRTDHLHGTSVRSKHIQKLKLNMVRYKQNADFTTSAIYNLKHRRSGQNIVTEAVSIPEMTVNYWATRINYLITTQKTAIFKTIQIIPATVLRPQISVTAYGVLIRGVYHEHTLYRSRCSGLSCDCNSSRIYYSNE